MWNKVKRIFVGTNQVYPVYRYSYDFRNKTKSQITSDGWTFPNSSTTNTGSNWISSNINDWSRVHRSVPNISNARKITITDQFQWSGNSDNFFWHNLWMGTTLSSSWSISDGTLMYVNNEGRLSLDIAGNPSIEYSATVGIWTYNKTIELDLVNKTYSCTLSWIGTYTGSLTDSDVAQVKTNIYRWVRYGFPNIYVQTIWFTVEY